MLIKRSWISKKERVNIIMFLVMNNSHDDETQNQF